MEYKENKQSRTYIWLFTINIFISAFTFGGGYVVVPMIRKYFVIEKKLFTEEELMNMAAIAQSTPGAIAINLAALAGYRVAGIGGVIVSCLGALLPPLLLLSIISQWYTAFAANRFIAAILKGMQAGAAALIVDLVVDMTQMILKQRSYLLTAMIPVAFVASYVLGCNVAWILLGACFLCILRIWWGQRGRKKSC